MAKKKEPLTTVDFAITGGTATNGDDYLLVDGTATVPATQISTTIQIDMLGKIPRH